MPSISLERCATSFLLVSFSSSGFVRINFPFIHRLVKLIPELKKQLLISDKLDQPYNHTILVRKGNIPSVSDINTLLTEMEQAGILKKLWGKYGIR